jgi:hypothetical protein
MLNFLEKAVEPHSEKVVHNNYAEIIALLRDV